MKIVFLGNFGVSYSSENHHVKTLESLGHEVICLQEGKIDGNEIVKQTLRSDLFVVVHTHGWVTPILPLSDKFGDFKDLKKKIDYYLEHDEERETIRIAGFERTKKDHTYKNRWIKILETI